MRQIRQKGHQEWGFRFYNRRAERSNRISAYIWNPEGQLGAGAYVEDRLTAGAWIYLVATFDDPQQAKRPGAALQGRGAQPTQQVAWHALQELQDRPEARPGARAARDTRWSKLPDRRSRRSRNLPPCPRGRRDQSPLECCSGEKAGMILRDGVALAKSPEGAKRLLVENGILVC